jgi:hypothetical protein
LTDKNRSKFMEMSPSAFFAFLTMPYSYGFRKKE